MFKQKVKMGIVVVGLFASMLSAYAMPSVEETGTKVVAETVDAQSTSEAVVVNPMNALGMTPEITSHADRSIVTPDYLHVVWTSVENTVSYEVTLISEDNEISSYSVSTNEFDIPKEKLENGKVYELGVTNLYGKSFLLSGTKIKFKYTEQPEEVVTGSMTHDTLKEEEKPLIVGKAKIAEPIFVCKRLEDLPELNTKDYFVVNKALGSVGRSVSKVEYMNDKVEEEKETLTQPKEVYMKNIPDDEKWARIFPDGHSYTSTSEALQHIVTVEIPAWNIGSNGEKYATTYSLQVNENLADEVVQIFVEIFNDPEQFPIKCIGGWRWSYVGSKLSQHNYGTCIDINPDENYMIRANGTIEYPGFWRPYDNPYSITPDGSVIRTFRKYGWGWGGADWQSSRDYMHLTYLGG